APPVGRAEIPTAGWRGRIAEGAARAELEARAQVRQALDRLLTAVGAQRADVLESSPDLPGFVADERPFRDLAVGDPAEQAAERNRTNGDHAVRHEPAVRPFFGRPRRRFRGHDSKASRIE